MPRKLSILLLALVVAVAAVAWLRRSGGQDAVAVPKADAAQADTKPVDLGTTPVQERRSEGGAQTPTAGPAAKTAEDPNLGKLLVHAVSKETRAPLAMVRVVVFPKHSPDEAAVGGSPVGGVRGTESTAPITATEGFVELDLTPRAAFTLWLYAEDGRAGHADADVAALSPGERRELTVELPTGNDLHYFGRLLAQEDHRPIDGGRVEVEVLSTENNQPSAGGSPDSPKPPPPEVVVSDATGQFELRTASWRPRSVRIKATGFSEALLEVTPKHDAPEKAKEILLTRSATLNARILDSRGSPILDAGVRLFTQSYNLAVPEEDELFLPSPDQVEWGARSNASGVCALESVPSGISLNVEVLRAGRAVRRDLPPLSLQPGETRDVEWVVGVGCLVEGRITDQSGDLVKGHPVWMQRADSDSPYVFEKSSGGEVRLSTTSDEKGLFSFADVGAGKWWVGPGATRAEGDPADPRSIAPFAQVVDVPEATPWQQVDLHVYRGLYIRGRVLLSSGEPAPRAPITAAGDSTGAGLFIQAEEDGSFALGPLAPDHYQLVAESTGKEAASELMHATEGQVGVILQLRNGGSLRCTVVDAISGAGVQASVTYSPRSAPEGEWSATSTEKDGTFTAEGLSAGTYDIAAQGLDGGACILRGVVIQAGVETSGVVLKLSPGGRVRFRNARTEGSVLFRVSSGGVTVGGDRVAAGQPLEVLVPAGPVLVQVIERGKWVEVTHFDVSAGEEKEAVFGGN